MKEKDLKHGAIVHGKIYHGVKRLFRKNVGSSPFPIDWNNLPQVKTLYNIKNQQQSSSCWGQAFSRAMQIALNSEELSAKSAYSPIFANGGGVDISLGEKEAKLFGLTTEKNIPSTAKDGTCTEQFMEDKSWMTAKNIDDCMTRAGYKVVNVPMNIDLIASTCLNNKFVIFLIHGQNGNTPSWLDTIPAPPSKANINPLWGHYVVSCCPILLNGKKYIKFYNSWSDKIGDKGFQYLSEDYIKSGYVADVITFIK